MHVGTKVRSTLVPQLKPEANFSFLGFLKTLVSYWKIPRTHEQDAGLKELYPTLSTLSYELYKYCIIRKRKR
jgi:hypothetical protein